MLRSLIGILSCQGVREKILSSVLGPDSGVGGCCASISIQVIRLGIQEGQVPCGILSETLAQFSYELLPSTFKK